MDQSATAFLAEFKTWARGFYPGVSPLLDRPRERCRVACLSNSNELHMAVLWESMDGQFERQFISCEMGLAKPEPALFAVVIRELGAASSAGMVGERVSGPDELRKRLRQHEILTV